MMEDMEKSSEEDTEKIPEEEIKAYVDRYEEVIRKAETTGGPILAPR